MQPNQQDNNQPPQQPQPLADHQMPGAVVQPNGAPAQPAQPQQPAQAVPPQQQTPIAQPQQVQAGFSRNDAMQLNKPSKKKPLLIGGGALGALLVACAAFLFVYLPNTPENIWRRGMASVGVGLEELLAEGTIQPSEANQFEGEINVTAPFEFSTTFDGTTTLSGEGDFNLEINWEKYNPKLQTYYTALSSQSPELYFRFSGIKTLVDDFAGPGSFNQITGGRKVENQWWVLKYQDLVDNGFITQSELDELFEEAESEELITAEEYNKLVAAFIESTSEYLFTEDTSKMVLEREENLGVEDFEGVSSQRYLVKVNKENLKLHLKDLRDRVLATGVLQRLDPETDFAAELSDQDIDEAVDEMEFDDVKIEAWVGLNNKVLRNLRFSDASPDEGDNSYAELSLLLDETNLERIPIRLRIAGDDTSSSGNIDFNVIADLAANSTEFNMVSDVTSKNGGSDVKFDGKLTITGLAEAPALEKPTGAKSIVKLVQDILGETNGILGITSDLLEEAQASQQF